MIRINELKKEYKDFELNVSLEVPAGCVVGLIGKNGAGKSTTIKSILGLIKTDGGEVEVFGKNPKEFKSADKAELGVALSDSGFSMMLKLSDVTKILKSMYRDFEEEKFQRLCKEQGLPTDKLIKDFSTGMKAKLRVLVAITHKAKLLILDEPTSGLDVTARNDVLDLLRAYLEEDPERSILISSHISSDLEGLCDSIYMIHKGRIVLHEDTDVIMGKYGIIKVSEEEYAKLDRTYLKAEKKESYGYCCLTNEKQFYLDNYPGLVIENNSIDDMIVLMTGTL